MKYVLLIALFMLSACGSSNPKEGECYVVNGTFFKFGQTLEYGGYALVSGQSIYIPFEVVKKSGIRVDCYREF